MYSNDVMSNTTCNVNVFSTICTETRALLRLERTMNFLEGGKGGEGRMGDSTGANSHRRPNKEIRSTYLTEKV